MSEKNSPDVNPLKPEDTVDASRQPAPSNPFFEQADSWFDRTFYDPPPPSAPPPPPPAHFFPTDYATNLESANNQPTETAPIRGSVLHTPVGEAIYNRPKAFDNLQNQLLIIVSLIVLVALGWTIFYLGYATTRQLILPLSLQWHFILGLMVLLLGVIGLGLIIREKLTPPEKASGYIVHRRERRVPITQGGITITERVYEMEFLSDEAKLAGEVPVKLTLTREQFEASAKTNRVFVVYSRTLGVCQVFQALRSHY